jgi:hypothetical protein
VQFGAEIALSQSVWDELLLLQDELYDAVVKYLLHSYE